MQNKIITIYELMGLIKDGKAPKQIKIGNHNLHFNGDYAGIEDMYYSDCDTRWINVVDIKLNTKVEILPEENDEWEDIEELKLQFGGDCKYRFTSENGTEYEFPQEIADIINQLIKNQKYLKEKIDKCDREN